MERFRGTVAAAANQRAASSEGFGVAVVFYAARGHTRDTAPGAMAMDATADAPLRIGNLRSAKSDKPIVAIGIEGSANKV